MRLLSVVVLLSLVACGTEPETLGLPALVGEWRSPTQSLQPTGTMERGLVVAADGQVEQYVILRGLYGWQVSSAVSMRDVLYGHLGLWGDRYVINPDSEVTEDLFYGPTDRTVRRDFTGWHADSVRYSIVGLTLIREYLTYPVDAPVLSRDVLFRVH